MAKKVIYRLVDDLTGETIEDGAGRTVKFGYLGSMYEIDLTAENAQAFHALLEPYVNAGRKADKSAGGSTAPKQARGGKEQVSNIRAWASENGYSISSRGRIPASIQEAYAAAN